MPQRFRHGCRFHFGFVGFVRKGPPEAVRTIRRTSERFSPRRHWCSALCSESTGNNSAPDARALRSSTRRPSRAFPCWPAQLASRFERAQRRNKTNRPTVAETTHVSLRMGCNFNQPGFADDDARQIHMSSQRACAQIVSGISVSTETTSGRCAAICSASSSTLCPAPKRDHAKTLAAERFDDAQSVATDRPGRAENRNSFWIAV